MIRRKLIFTTDYEAARQRAALLAARPFIPPASAAAPTRQTGLAAVLLKSAKVVGSAVVVLAVLASVGLLLHAAEARNKRIYDAHNACLREGRVIYRGLCIDPETVQRIILEQERSMK